MFGMVDHQVGDDAVELMGRLDVMLPVSLFERDVVLAHPFLH